MNNHKQTIISQYGNSPRLLSMIQTMQDSIDPSADIDNFYNLVVDLDTAWGFGLDIWGRIVGVNRVLNVAPVGNYLGFKEGQTIVQDYQTFDHGVFYDGPETGAYVLSDDAFRLLIFVKALANISDGSPFTYNKLLSLLFNQKVYCVETGPFAVTYIFEHTLEPYQVAILANNSVVPRPNGVTITIA